MLDRRGPLIQKGVGEDMKLAGGAVIADHFCLSRLAVEEASHRAFLEHLADGAGDQRGDR